MRKGLLVSIALALVLGVGVFAATEQFSTARAASATQHFHFKGLAAEASFSSIDQDNIETFVYIFADRSTTRTTTGRPATVSQVYVEFGRYDLTNLTFLINAYGTASPAPLRIDNQLTAATLGTATVSVYDEFYTGDTYTITLSGSWAGAGSLSRNTTSYHYSEPGFIVNSHSHGTFRSATATANISVVSSGGVEVASFAGALADFADMRSAKDGEVFIYQK